MEENNSENLIKEKSTVRINKSRVDKEKSRIILNETRQKKAEKVKQNKANLFDVMKISQFLNDHIKNLGQDLNESAEIRFGIKEEDNDLNYLEVVKDFKKEKLMDNYTFFYNGKEFTASLPQKAKKEHKFTKNILIEKNKATYRINPITKCQINFSDDENSDFNNYSDIDIYLDD